MRTFLTCYGLACLLVWGAGQPARAAGLELQAEDALFCPELTLSPEKSRELSQLQEKRRELARTISTDQRMLTQTLFGIRLDEPRALDQWRESEDKAVRKLLEASDLKKVEPFARQIRDRLMELDQTFPRGRVVVEVNQSVDTVDEVRTLKIGLRVPVQSPTYQIRYETRREDDKLILYVTLVRPSTYTLSGMTPEPSVLEASFLVKDLPRNIEIWTRNMDTDLPLNTEYQRLGTSPVPEAG